MTHTTIINRQKPVTPPVESVDVTLKLSVSEAQSIRKYFGAMPVNDLPKYTSASLWEYDRKAISDLIWALYHATEVK